MVRIETIVPALVAVAALLIEPATASAEIVYNGGHADIGVAFEDGELDLHYHFDTSSTQEEPGGATVPIVPPGTIDPEAFEFSPSEIFVRAPDPSVARPAGSQWDFTGTVEGGDLWILPQVQEVGKAFLGFASEDLDPGDWVGDVTWAMTGAIMPAGGQFSVWQSGIFGEAIRLYDTQDDNFLNDVVTGVVGGHDHYNWGFTTPGVYQIELTATATHADFGPVSDTETFTFLVGDATPSAVPEPSSFALLGISGLAAIGMRLRRRRQRNSGPI